MHNFITYTLLVAGAMTAIPVLAAGLNYPAAPKRPVTDTYHGVQVSDPYRWLENPNSKPVREWSAAQAAAVAE